MFHILSALAYSMLLSFATVNAAVASSSAAASLQDEEPAGSMIVPAAQTAVNASEELEKPEASIEQPLGSQPLTTSTSPTPAPSPYARLVPHWNIPGETVTLQFLIESGKLKGYNPIGKSDAEIVAQVNHQQFWRHPNTTNTGYMLHKVGRKIKKLFK